MNVQAAEIRAAQGDSAFGASGSTNRLQRAIIWILLAGAFVLTVYGLVRFDWQGRPRWVHDEVQSLVVTLALPALILTGSSWWRRWPLLVVLVVLGAILVTYGPAVLAVLIFCGAGFAAVGLLIFRIRLDSLESALLACILGYGVAGVFIGYTAQFRIHFDFVYGATLGTCIFFTRHQLRGWLSKAWARVSRPAEGSVSTRVANNFGVAVAVLLLVMLMLYATVREGGHDGLVTHFYLTESLRLSGSFGFDQTLSPFVFMPKTAVWGLGVFDVVGGEYALRAAHASLLAVTVALIGMRTADTMGRGGAGLLVATLLSAPVVFWISSHFFEETGTLAFVTASALFFLRGLKTEDSLLQDFAGLACLGMAVSSKPQALFLGALGVAFVVRRLLTTPSPKGLLTVAGSSAVFLVMAVGPYARAYLATGNPFFPFVPGGVLDSRWERPLTISAPYDMIFSTAKHMETYSGGFAFQFILLLACAAASVFLARMKSVSALAIVGLVFAAVLADQTLYARYQIYAFPLYMLACAAIYPALAKVGRWILLAILAAFVPLNLQFWPGVHVADFTIAHLTSPELNSQVPPERRAFAVLNDLYGKQTSVYVAGSLFSAGLAGTPHAASQVARKIDASTTMQDVARNMRDAGITHVVASEPVRNPLVLEACRFICKEFPIGAPDYKIFTVDLSRASILADRLNAAELLGVDGPEGSALNLPATMEPGAGWGAREDWGWWSIAPTAEIKLGQGFAGATELKARVQAFAPPGTQGLDVTILLDGAEVGSWRFEPGAVGQIVGRTIQLGGPISETSAKILVFRFSHTYTPKDTTGGGDLRQLALGLIALTR